MACFLAMEASKVLSYLIMIRHVYVKGGKTLEGIFFFVTSSSNDRKSVLVIFWSIFWKIGQNEILPPIAIT